MAKSLPDDKNFATSKLKVCGDNLNFLKWYNFSMMGVGKIVGKGQKCWLTAFSLNAFQMLLSICHENQGLFGKVLQTIPNYS